MVFRIKKRLMFSLRKVATENCLRSLSKLRDELRSQGKNNISLLSPINKNLRFLVRQVNIRGLCVVIVG